MTEHEQQADELQERSDRLGAEIAQVRKDWEHKKHDESFPGALTPETDEAPEGEAAEREPWPDE
jgi:hypothetical protein